MDWLRAKSGRAKSRMDLSHYSGKATHVARMRATSPQQHITTQSVRLTEARGAFRSRA